MRRTIEDELRQVASTKLEIMNTAEMNKECVETCNSLLRGERSAVETYDIAIDKFSSHAVKPHLERIRSEHVKSVGDLETRVKAMGATPDSDSGAWGTFAKAVQNTANVFGKESAIASLQRGEEHGRKDYEDALDEKEVSAECKTLIRNVLLPRVESHIAELDRLEETID